MTLQVRPARQGDEAAWRTLWAGYCAFYEVALPEPNTAATWARICDPASPIGALVAEKDGAVIGFANYVVHENTFERVPICYLEDLFVSPAARGSGAATALLLSLKDAMALHGWARLYWVTHRDNATARRVYDRFIKADDFVRYVVRKAA